MSDKVISSYIGAYPDGKPAPKVAKIPKEVNTLLLAFAREPDRDGKFQINWDTSSMHAITPEVIAADKAANGRRYLVSLAGDANPFNPRIDLNDWIENAFSSLCTIIDDNHLDGVDCNYENIDDQNQFVEAMGRLFQRLAGQYPDASFSVAPYNATWPLYRDLLNGEYGQYITWNNYQEYADGHGDKESNVQALKAVAEETSWATLVYGVVTNQSSPRGATPDTALEVVGDLKSRLQGTFTWSAEDSAPEFSYEVQAAGIFNG